jgi:hypothetical protein
MTIKELINKLQEINNQEMIVVVDGYEGGFDDIKKIKTITVYEKTDHNWWDGKYEQSSSGQQGIVVLLLPR